MKAFASLLILSLGAAYAQRVEGDYENFQWGREIHRTLHLDRSGDAEIVTEVSGADEDRNSDRNGRDDYARYGWTATEAARGHAVHQTGRWTFRDDRVELRLDAVRDRTGFRTRGRADVELVPRDGGFVLAHAESLYGRDEIEFHSARREPTREAPRPATPRRVGYDGSVRLGDDLLALDGVDFTESEGKGTLVVRTGKRRIELRGTVERHGDETLLHAEGDGVDRLFGRDAGTLTLVLEDGKVRSVRGTVHLESGKLDFGRADARPIEDGNFITP